MMRIPLSSVYNSNNKNIEDCHCKYLTMTKGNKMGLCKKRQNMEKIKPDIFK